MAFFLAQLFATSQLSLVFLVSEDVVVVLVLVAAAALRSIRFEPSCARCRRHLHGVRALARQWPFDARPIL